MPCWHFANTRIPDAPCSSFFSASSVWDGTRPTRRCVGAVIHVAACGSDICATLIALSKSAPSTVDGKNPDAALRTRPLCGLRIGEGFQGSGDKAEGGHLYDPKSGKTYRGTMTAKSNELDLRGYIGIKAFGRSETWTRMNEAPAACLK